MLLVHDESHRTRHNISFQMTIETYLCALFVNLFINLGIYTLMRPGMLLGPIGDYLYMKAPEHVHKPLFSCPPCMSSVWGTTFFFLSDLHNLVPYWLFPVHCLILCGLTTIVMFWDHEK